MTLGERLRKYMPEGVEQKLVAMNWIGRMEKAGMKPLSGSTAQSRLSELLADDPQGVRAFFRDPRRANALFDELAVPEAERTELRSLAEPILAGTTQPRLVADVSDLGSDRATMDAAFVGLREALFGDDGVFPVVVVLTNAQYDLLPRSFDRFKDRMQVELVDDAAGGADAAIRLAGDSTCVVGRRPLVNLARWWALDVNNDGLQLEPADGLARVRATGNLGVPSVAHPLDGLVARSPGKPGSAVNLPATGIARRRLVAELADEDSATSKNSASWRAAAAEQLGVHATSTARERIEAEIATVVSTLDMEISSGTAEQWDSLLARAARRPTKPFAMRVGDTVRVMNPPATVTSAGRLQVARVTCAEPHLVTLERAIAELTEDDLLDDPLLGQLIHRLANNDEQALKLLFHARAVLVYGGRVRPRAIRAAKDPLAVLKQLVASEVPQARLRIKVDDPRTRFGSADYSVDLAPFAYPDGKIYFNVLAKARLLHGVPPVGDILFARGTELKAVVPRTGHEARGYPYLNNYHSHRDVSSAVALVDPNADAVKWLDDIEASPFFGATVTESAWNSARHLPEPQEGHRWLPVPEPENLWLNADTNLALAWLALRSAVRTPLSIRMPNGSLLLQIGGGLAARIVVRRYGTPDSAIRAAVRCMISRARVADGHEQVWRFGDLRSPVTTHVANTAGYHTCISVLMPSIWIAGRGYAVDVTFIEAPMLPNSPVSADTFADATAGAVAALESDERADSLQAMWDDD